MGLIAQPTTAEIGCPPSCLVSIEDGLKRIIQDGFDALTSSATLTWGIDLHGCSRCACLDQRRSIDILDVDAWKDCVYGMAQGKPKSVDLALLVLDANGSRSLLPVEGKLGAQIVESCGGSSVTVSDLEEKCEGLRKLLNGRSALTISDKLLLVIPKSGQEWMWYKVRNWNDRGNSIGKILSCCIADFQLVVNAGPVQKPASCSINRYRVELLKMELAYAGKMHRVQLAPPDYCSMCGECKKACIKHAISMVKTDESGGRIRPFVDERSCVGCRLCEKACPVLRGRLIVREDVSG